MKPAPAVPRRRCSVPPLHVRCALLAAALMPTAGITLMLSALRLADGAVSWRTSSGHAAAVSGASLVAAALLAAGAWRRGAALLALAVPLLVGAAAAGQAALVAVFLRTVTPLAVAVQLALLLLLAATVEGTHLLVWRLGGCGGASRCRVQSLQTPPEEQTEVPPDEPPRTPTLWDGDLESRPVSSGRTPPRLTMSPLPPLVPTQVPAPAPANEPAPPPLWNGSIVSDVSAVNDEVYQDDDSRQRVDFDDHGDPKDGSASISEQHTAPADQQVLQPERPVTGHSSPDRWSTLRAVSDDTLRLEPLPLRSPSPSRDPCRPLSPGPPASPPSGPLAIVALLPLLPASRPARRRAPGRRASVPAVSLVPRGAQASRVFTVSQVCPADPVPPPQPAPPQQHCTDLVWHPPETPDPPQLEGPRKNARSASTFVMDEGDLQLTQLDAEELPLSSAADSGEPGRTGGAHAAHTARRHMRRESAPALVWSEDDVLHRLLHNIRRGHADRGRRGGDQ
ncbi:hypothetical protein FJT64_018253 [Amphibalanus amphitrite]|uniref:Uncharacterized protein n=1 Tax=Amphibalanus amphitrite TaxID=1232801 RepID=A0A6A4X4H7_AMPAM|nr:hypothetical protein FJT64_018253 [Amphibalanus amphitrite]